MFELGTWTFIDAAAADEATCKGFFGADNERRMHLQAYRYWQSRLAGRRMPRLSDCADLMATSFASRLALIDLPGAAADARISVVGIGLEKDLRSAHLTMRDPFASLLERLPLIEAEGAPIAFEADLPFLASADADYAVRGILLPLADDAGRISAVMAVMNWR